MSQPRPCRSAPGSAWTTECPGFADGREAAPSRVRRRRGGRQWRLRVRSDHCDHPLNLVCRRRPVRRSRCAESVAPARRRRCRQDRPAVRTARLSRLAADGRPDKDAGDRCRCPPRGRSVGADGHGCDHRVDGRRHGHRARRQGVVEPGRRIRVPGGYGCHRRRPGRGGPGQFSVGSRPGRNHHGATAAVVAILVGVAAALVVAGRARSTGRDSCGRARPQPGDAAAAETAPGRSVRSGRLHVGLRPGAKDQSELHSKAGSGDLMFASASGLAAVLLLGLGVSMVIAGYLARRGRVTRGPP